MRDRLSMHKPIPFRLPAHGADQTEQSAMTQRHVPGCPRSPDVQSAVAHTPGPWSIGKRQTFRVSVCAQHDDLVASVVVAFTDRVDVVQLPEGNANARLIAAAPDLLAALRDVRAFVQAEMEIRIDSHTIRGDLATLDDEDGGSVGEAMDCLHRIEAAISKAEGRP